MNREPHISNHGRARPAARVAVIGAGLSGLIAANHLADHGCSVTVHEARSGAGGRARTDHQHGFDLNLGPHALYIGGPAATALAELGVDLAGGRPATKGRVLHDGRLHIGPGDPFTLLRTGLLSMAGKFQIARVLARLPGLDPTRWATRSTADWLEGTVADHRARALVRALVRLTSYVDDPETLSAEVALAQVQAGLGHGVLYLHRGWGRLIDQLEHRLTGRPNVTLDYGRVSRELPDADAVIVATGDPVSTGRLLGHRHRTGPSARVAGLDLGLRGNPPHDFVLGIDVPFYLSNHGGPARLAPAGHSLVSCASYLPTRPQTDAAHEAAPGSAPGRQPGSDPVARRQAMEELALRCGVDPERVVHRRYLHDMVVVSAMATAELGGLAGRPRVTDTGRNDVFIAGDWVGPVGHMADASAASGREAARACIRRLATIPTLTGG